ncbi:MAG: hypothetical protein AAGF91_00205 [Actinomycetota bacterium]
MTTFEVSPSSSSTQTRRPIEVDPIDPSLPFPKYSAAVRDRPQAAWRTLDAARRGAFTGELVFEASPAVTVYLDGGDVYWAGGADDPPLGRQLVDAGTIDEAQLRRSSVSVGDVDHLGRMFELDESIDRGAVLVEIERSTAQTIASLVSDVVATATTTAYRHHPAGIRTWFSRIGIDHPVRVNRPLDLDDIPAADAAGGRVDWDGEFSTLTRPRDRTRETTSTKRSIIKRTTLPRLRLDRTARRADRSTRRAAHATDERTSATADEMLRRPADRPANQAEGTPPSSPAPAAPAPTPAASPAPPPSGAPAPTPPAVPPPSTQNGRPASTPSGASTPPTDSTRPTGGGLPAPSGPVHLADLPAPDAVVPDTVAHAVRRALDAIEVVNTPQGGVLSLIDGSARRAAGSTDAVATAPPTQPAPSGSPFAPPTPDMRAEVIYARMAAEAEAAAAGHAGVDPDVDDGGGSGRTKALRRLIGSLRRP